MEYLWFFPLLTHSGKYHRYLNRKRWLRLIFSTQISMLIFGSGLRSLTSQELAKWRKADLTVCHRTPTSDKATRQQLLVRRERSLRQTRCDARSLLVRRNYWNKDKAAGIRTATDNLQRRFLSKSKPNTQAFTAQQEPPNTSRFLTSGAALGLQLNWKQFAELRTQQRTTGRVCETLSFGVEPLTSRSAGHLASLCATGQPKDSLTFERAFLNDSGLEPLTSRSAAHLASLCATGQPKDSSVFQH